MPNRRPYPRKPSYCRALDLRITHTELVDAYLIDSHREATVTQYRAFVKQWCDWCDGRAACPLPSTDDEFLEFLAERADAGTGYPTLLHLTSAVNCFHASNGYDRENSVKVRTFLRLQRRAHVSRPMRPIYPDDVRAMCDLSRFLYGPLRAARDCALLIHLFVTAERNGELCAAVVDDLIRLDATRLIVSIPKSKGDPMRLGQRVAIKAGPDPQYCPIATLEQWLRMSGITEGPVFRRIDRHGRVGAGALDRNSLCRLIREYCTKLGLGDHYGPHSFRRGWATSADELGCDLLYIKQHLRHQHDETTESYIDRDRIDWTQNITGLLLTCEAGPVPWILSA